jgi:hypothetical protein
MTRMVSRFFPSIGWGLVVLTIPFLGVSIWAMALNSVGALVALFGYSLLIRQKFRAIRAFPDA